MLVSMDRLKVWLAAGHTDLRKSIDGLSVLVSEGFRFNPFSSSLFFFCNRKRDKLKILHWGHNGFWLYYRRLHEHLLAREVLQADETTLQVLKEPGRAAHNQSFMWLYRTGRDGPPIVLFDYQQTRAGQHPLAPLAFLEGFSGFLHVDGYAGYDRLPNVTLVGCWAHARRRFDEALKAIPIAFGSGISSRRF